MDLTGIASGEKLNKHNLSPTLLQTKLKNYNTFNYPKTNSWHA